MKVLIKNLARIVTGDISDPISAADSIFIEGGIIKGIGRRINERAGIVIDAKKTIAIPGLIDSHVHPVFGEFAPPQKASNWIWNYVHGGVTTMISAGELHLPGLPLERLSPSVVKNLAILARLCYEGNRDYGAKVHGGTVLLVHGMAERDFDEMFRNGVRCAKFIFYDFEKFGFEEAKRYIRWCRKRGIKTKIHSGGVSRSGLSQITGARTIRAIKPDIVAHVNGGPIPMPTDEAEGLVRERDMFLEIASSGNYKVALRILKAAARHDALSRIIVGTDTPGGTGIIPRGMLRNLLFISSLGEIRPELAVCMATGNASRAHDVPSGMIKKGRPADIVIMDKIRGSVTHDALESIGAGDLPGISVVMIDGNLVVKGRSEQTPPPERRCSVSSPA